MMLGPAERLVKHSSAAGLAKGAWSRCPRVRRSLATQTWRLAREPEAYDPGRQHH